MKRAIVTACFFFAGCVAAAAADYALPSPSYPDSYPAQPDSFFKTGLPSAWSGPYFGANFGGGRGKLSGEILGLRGSVDADGAFGGIHAGYDVRAGAAVFGVEADLQVSGIGNDVDLGAGTRIDGKLTWFSTLRGRVGFVAEPFLVYGTGGLAFGHGSASAELLGLSLGTASRLHRGWTLGAGVEAAVGQGLITRFEYLYADFGSRNYLSDLSIDSRAGLKAHLFRVGASMYF